MTFIDSHCHLPHVSNKDALEENIRNAQAWDVTQFINIGTSIEENAKVIETAERYPSVFAAVAIYPHKHLNENVENLIEELEKQAISSKRIVAIGECGIDLSNWSNQRPLDKQIKLFETQINLSVKLNLPLVIHNRHGDEIVLDLLSRNREAKGVVHCFDSTWEIAQEFLNLGLTISFSGLVTYESKNSLSEVVKKVPKDRYLLETDAPYLLPEPAKSETRELQIKRKNEPKYVRMVGQKVAEIREISLDEVAFQTLTNTSRLFGLKS